MELTRIDKQINFCLLQSGRCKHGNKIQFSTTRDNVCECLLFIYLFTYNNYYIYLLFFVSYLAFWGLQNIFYQSFLYEIVYYTFNFCIETDIEFNY